VKVRVYVEGGGDHNKDLQTQCRRGFRKFLEKAGLQNRMPAIVACGGRRRAYDSFRTSHESVGQNDLPILLVDSETPVAQTDPWEHVRLRAEDRWPRPISASEDQIHLMVQAMEAWFHADREGLQKYFGQGFRLSALRARPDIDNIPKADLFGGMQMATRDCLKKGEYSKGQHSFEILGLIDPAKVRASSPHAERLLTTLERICTP
jgi:hypothetical protein